MRSEILELVESIKPYDALEVQHILHTIEWIESGAEIFRIQKPDIPPKHLVVYFVLVDQEKKKVMLVDHIKAELWIPAGGHVEKDEHPTETVKREIQEELNVIADFISKEPFFITESITVGKTAGHTDVTLWYILTADSEKEITYDPSEFNGYKWFSYDDILKTPIERLNPHVHRFMKKFLNSHE